MKYIIVIACLLCSTAMAQNKPLEFKAGKLNQTYSPIIMSGLFNQKVIDTVYATENNTAVRTIQKVYTLSDSTKYTEKYKAEWNDKKQYWDFKSVNVVRGQDYSGIGSFRIWNNYNNNIMPATGGGIIVK